MLVVVTLSHSGGSYFFKVSHFLQRPQHSSTSSSNATLEQQEKKQDCLLAHYIFIVQHTSRCAQLAGSLITGLIYEHFSLLLLFVLFRNCSLSLSHTTKIEKRKTGGIHTCSTRRDSKLLAGQLDHITIIFIVFFILSFSNISILNSRSTVQYTVDNDRSKTIPCNKSSPQRYIKSTKQIVQLMVSQQQYKLLLTLPFFSVEPREASNTTQQEVCACRLRITIIMTSIKQLSTQR